MDGFIVKSLIICDKKIKILEFRIRRGKMKNLTERKWKEELLGFKKVLIMVIFIFLFIFAYSVSNSTAAEYVIGGIVSTTGYAAYMGQSIADGEALTLKLLNEKGGIKGFPIKFIAPDDGGKPDRALTIVKRLLMKENVIAIVGDGLTACVTAISPYLNEVGVPFIFCAGGKTYDLPKEKFMFGVLPNTPIVINSRLRYFKKQGLTRVAMIADSTAYGEENVKYVPAAVQRAGMELIDVSRIGVGDIDLTATLSRIKAKNPELIFIAAGGDDACRLTKQMKQVGLNVINVHPSSSVDEAFVRNLGEAAMGDSKIYADAVAGYLTIFHSLPDNDPRKIKGKPYVTRFEKEYGKKFNWTNATGYDMLVTLAKAIEAVAPPADKINYNDAAQMKKIRSDIRDWMENTKGLELLLGTYNRSPDDHIGVKDVGLVKLINGKWNLVD
jgi:branched-chain amino acid transport system substrate-binding protein